MNIALAAINTLLIIPFRRQMRMGDAIGSTGIISVKKYSHFVRLPSKTWLAFSYFVYIYIYVYRILYF